MTTRQHAREVLRVHRYNLAAASALPDEIRRLDLAIASPRVSNPEKLPGGSGENDRLERLIQRRDELALRLEMAQLAARAVQRALDALRPDERHILEAMDVYGHRGAAERLCDELHYADATSVRRAEARALDHFAVMLGGVFDVE